MPQCAPIKSPNPATELFQRKHHRHFATGWLTRKWSAARLCLMTTMRVCITSAHMFGMQSIGLANQMLVKVGALSSCPAPLMSPFKCVEVDLN